MCPLFATRRQLLVLACAFKSSSRLRRHTNLLHSHLNFVFLFPTDQPSYPAVFPSTKGAKTVNAMELDTWFVSRIKAASIPRYGYRPGGYLLGTGTGGLGKLVPGIVPGGMYQAPYQVEF